MTKTNHLRLGEDGEQLAADYLQKQGYTILARRFRTKVGEIDIIAKEDDYLVFVEVKTRRSTIYGWPSESVTWRKQQKIIKTALWFMKDTGNLEAKCRFDVVEIIFGQKMAIQYNHIKHAFGGC